MRILQVIETGGPGGAETVFANLAAGLASAGHYVHCVVGDGSWLPNELKRRDLSYSLLSNSGSLDLTLLGQLRASIAQHRIDVVHAHLFDGAVYASLAGWLAGVPRVVTLHGHVDLQSTSAVARLKRFILRRLSSRVITVSYALRGEVGLRLGVADDAIQVIYNGVPDMASHRIVAPNGVGTSSGPRLVSIGNIRRPKNYPLLLDAVSSLRVEFPLLRLDVLGEPDREGLQEMLDSQVERLGLQAHVTFHGFVADPLPFLQSADAFVLSSDQEGFSLATVEAMLAGTPVVSTRSGGPEEIVEHGSTGILVQVGSSVELAAALGRVIREREWAMAMAGRAASVARERFSARTMTINYLKCYHQVLNCADV